MPRTEPFDNPKGLQCGTLAGSSHGERFGFCNDGSECSRRASRAVTYSGHSILTCGQHADRAARKLGYDPDEMPDPDPHDDGMPDDPLDRRPEDYTPDHHERIRSDDDHDDGPEVLPDGGTDVYNHGNPLSCEYPYPRRAIWDRNHDDPDAPSLVVAYPPEVVPDAETTAPSPDTPDDPLTTPTAAHDPDEHIPPYVRKAVAKCFGDSVVALSAHSGSWDALITVSGHGLAYTTSGLTVRSIRTHRDAATIQVTVESPE